MKKIPLNANEMKALNRKALLRLVRQFQASRAEIAQKTGLTRASVSLLADELLYEGMIVEGKKNESAKGRKSVALKINGGYGFCIGLNITRESYHVGLVDFTGNLLSHNDVTTTDDLGISEILALIDADICALKNQGSGVFLGIGITTPGPINKKTGVTFNIPNFEKWNNFKIVKYFNEKHSCPAVWENNSCALALTEHHFNSALQEKSYAEFIIDSGIGSGIILHRNDENLLIEAELGHTALTNNRQKCNCGNYDCAELYASIRSIEKYARQADPALANWKIIVDSAVQGSEPAIKILDRECDFLATLLINCANSFNLNRFVLTGDISYNFTFLHKILSDKINKRPIRTTAPDIYISQIPNPEIISSAFLILLQ